MIKLYGAEDCHTWKVLIKSAPLGPPIDDIESYWSPAAKAHASRMLARSVIGGPATVKQGLDALIEETAAEELILVSDIYDRTARHHSFEIVASVMGLSKG